MAPSGAPQQPHLKDLLVDIRRLPSVIAQLAYLAELRDPNTGTYSHQAIRERELRRQADLELRRLHESTFRHWLNLRLQHQKVDLDLHISGIPSDKATVVRTWTSLETYRTFLPASASLAERQLFVGNLEILLRLAAGQTEPPRNRLRLPAEDGAWLNVRQVSACIRVPARTLRLWAENGAIPAIKVGRQWRFQRRDVEEWLGRPLRPDNC